MPARILLVRLSHLGDAVHALPVYHALRAAYPGAEIGWVIQPEFADLVRGLARVFLFDRRGGLGAWRRLRRELSDWKPDWVVDAQGNMKSAVATWCSGAERKTGLARGDWREPFGARVLNDFAPQAEGPHAMDRMLALAQYVGPVDGASAGPRVDPGLTAEERARGEALLGERFSDASDGAFILQLATPGDVRSWPAQSFAELAVALAAAGRFVLCLSGPAEAELGARLRAEVMGERVAHWVGQRGLRELAGVYTAAAEKGVRLVACDSGPAHLAAACGLAVTLLAGPQDPQRTGPWSLDPNRHDVITADDPPPCLPCLARRCEHLDGPVCLTRIEAPRVAKTLLNKSGSREKWLTR